MIVTSLLSEKKYFWVKVPRTGTHAYQRLLFPELHQEKTLIFHSHAPFLDFSRSMCVKKPHIEHGVSVVRHPQDKFISGLRYFQMKSVFNKEHRPEKFLKVCDFCGEVSEITHQQWDNETGTPNVVLDFLQDETTFYDFIYSYFDRNCMLKSGYTWEQVFQTENLGAVHSIFKPQVFFAYHPKVKIFHYENIQEFNSWIETTLGISTATLTTENTSKHHILNIDVTTKKFHDLVRYLFHDDFQVFGYS